MMTLRKNSPWYKLRRTLCANECCTTKTFQMIEVCMSSINFCTGNFFFWHLQRYDERRLVADDSIVWNFVDRTVDGTHVPSLWTM
jgi:hypothetical protein